MTQADMGSEPTQPETPADTVKRRCVFFIAGYDPKTPKAFFERMRREIRRFEKTWDVETTVSPDIGPGAEVSSIEVTADKPGLWHVDTDFHFLVIDSIVQKDFARPLPVRIARYVATFFDYLLTGTIFAMFRHGWRFGLYMLYPMVVFCLFAALSLLVGATVAEYGGWLPGLLAGLASLWGLLVTLGRRWSILHLMDLWSFSLDYLRGRRPNDEALAQRFASEIVMRSNARRYDEILLIGHSTGGGLILDVAARTLQLNPNFPRQAPEVSMLTLGSTALKLGLHPAARDYRRRVQSLVDAKDLKWGEYQCLTDPINFYRSEPVSAMKLTPRRQEEAFPLVRTVRMRDCLDPAVYKRIRHNFFRVHYQFVYGNTKRHFYDFFMICFGPRTLSKTLHEWEIDPFLTGEETG